MYATREHVMSSLEILDSAYAGVRIDAAIDAASRAAEGFLHRRFYPEQRTILMDWPDANNSLSWDVDLGDQELISVSQVLSGGTDITAGVILRRWDYLAEPPYTTLSVNLSGNTRFSSGTSWQQSLSIGGVFGYNDTATTLAGAALSGAINSSVSSIVLNPIGGTFTIGIGALLKVESERMIIVDRRMSTTSVTTTSAMLDVQNANTFTTAGASSLAIGEIILIDGERMRINDIAGSTVIVTRAWDGAPLATHSSGATIYALRTCIVQRGALGSTAASHADTTSVYVHKYPPLLTEMVSAEAINMLEQAAAGYARTIGAGAGTREATGVGIDDIRERAYRELGRKNRSRAV